MRGLSGLKKVITMSQMQTTMSAPRGSMYQMSEKKPISVPPVNFWNMPAPATARAESQEGDDRTRARSRPCR